MIITELSEQISALRKCTFLPGSYDKRFVRDVGSCLDNMPEKELTERQVTYIKTLYHKYRKQIQNHKALCEICGKVETHQDKLL